ncbi:unnamed protein product [Parnassius apollo]|uniref:(apollo) hypothetical protein n=1 Tax=Parnassius apollo TaxID=110799 RepID=A0A8S3WYX3_PARAO|nr:unnamed protein product [Parnassius apollo]
MSAPKVRDAACGHADRIALAYLSNKHFPTSRYAINIQRTPRQPMLSLAFLRSPLITERYQPKYSLGSILTTRSRTLPEIIDELTVQTCTLSYSSITAHPQLSGKLTISLSQHAAARPNRRSHGTHQHGLTDALRKVAVAAAVSDAGINL